MAKGFHPNNNSSEAPLTSSEANNNTIQEQNMNSGNRSALSLPLINQMAIPIYTSPSQEEVEVGGRVLFHDFIHHQFEAEELSDDLLGVQHDDDPFPAGPSGDVGPQIRFRTASPSVASTPEGYNNENWIRMGNSIRELADQFAASKERPLIKKQADQVDLNHINHDSFFQLMDVVFQNGINRQCIVALFFFCSDVLIRCVRQQLREKGSRLFLWCMQYLVERVCRWVYAHGGWERVFSQFYRGMLNVAGFIAFAVILSFGFTWLRRKL